MKKKPATKSNLINSIERDLLEEESPVISSKHLSHRALKSKKGAPETSFMLSQETKKRKEKERTKERERLEKVSSHKDGR